MSVLGGPDAPVLVVAGATGTGKSTVCSWLAERGAFVIEADRVGHEVLLREEVRDALVDEFGGEILDDGGEVDRRRLGRTVFADESRLAALDRIVHPPLVREIERRIHELRQSRSVQLIVVDAALHFQFEPPLECDAVLATTAAPELQLKRIRERDGLTEREARDRIERQHAVSASVERADAVLDTGVDRKQTRAELLTTVDRLLSVRLQTSDPSSHGLGSDDGEN